MTPISFDYAGVPLLKGIQLTLARGEILHVQGDNGSGKTTLIKLIAGLLRPTEGTIYVQQQTLDDDKTHYQRNLCYVGHKLGLHPVLSLRENCYFDAHYGRKALDWGRVLDAFSLTDLVDLPAGMLSAGQRRRVALLRLWMTDAPLWLLDEPLLALDSKAIAFLMQQLHVHQQAGGAVLLTSHQALPPMTRAIREVFL